jgi:hypothetical protein
MQGLRRSISHKAAVILFCQMPQEKRAFSDRFAVESSGGSASL